MGAALAAVAGTLYLTYYGVIVFTDGFVPGVKAFTAAVLGGIGSLPGAVLGVDCSSGLSKPMWAAYFSSEYKDVAAFAILAIVLIFMPSGIAWPARSGKSLISHVHKSRNARKPTSQNALRDAFYAGLVALGLFVSADRFQDRPEHQE